MRSGTNRFSTLLLCLLCSIWPLTGTAAEQPFTFGLLLVGPANDHGWSQAHYEAAREIEKQIPGTALLYIDKVNPVDRPGITVPVLVDDLAAKGARLIIANSDDMKDGIREAAAQHPELQFIHVSGDDVKAGKAGENLSNLMVRMEYGKMMAGFVAALTTQTGKISYIGPLINEETRRLAVSAYLGARYAWTEVLKKPADTLQFRVSWIGFWFNIPGVTSDPTLVARSMIDGGSDVLISGIDTTEVLVVAGQKRAEGKAVWAVPYDFEGACNEAPSACLGVPYYNWFPGYKQLIGAAKEGQAKQQALWLGPDWGQINDRHSSSVGFLPGQALSDTNKEHLLRFQKGLADGSISLFKGPLNFQDGASFLQAGVTATDEQIWYMPQLLEGMEGASK